VHIAVESEQLFEPVWSKYSADLHWLMATVNLGRRL
jgi:hypothetical protein